MGINKVEYAGDVLIDLTEDTVTEDSLLEGYTAHAADGRIITGTHTEQITDVQINNSTIVTDTVANIPIATSSSLGVIKPGTNVTVNADGKINFTVPSNYLDKNATTTNRFRARFYIGDMTVSSASNISNAYTHVRAVTSPITESSYNGACFAVHSNGAASFQHKVYTAANESGARNAAVLRFYGTQQSKKGSLQFAVNTGSSNDVSEEMFKDVALVDDIKEVLIGNKGESWTQEEKNKAKETLGITTSSLDELSTNSIKLGETQLDEAKLKKLLALIE